MAENLSDRTEAPTPRRLEEAREQGKIAHSPDLTAAVLLLGFFVLLSGFGDSLIRAMRTILTELLSERSMADVSPQQLGPVLLRVLMLAAGGLAPLLAGAVVIALAVNILQLGVVFNARRLTINFGILNPARNLRSLMQADNWTQLALNVAKVGLACLMAWTAVRNRLDEVVGIQRLGCAQAFGLGASLVYAVGVRIALLMVVLALCDYGYRWYRTRLELRMTKEEVKEELRHMEGDPKVRQRRRQIAIQLSQQRVRREVPKADVVITNPTEYAVALRYDEKTMQAPRCVAKGRGPMARHIRQVAAEAGVPIIERPPLARALYRMVEVGQEIPEQFYAAVAEILAYVYELAGRLRRRGA